MKTTILILSLILLGCDKKTTKQPEPSTQQTTKAWCWYQMNYGNKAFFKCSKTETEFNDTYQQGISNGLNLTYEIKNNCNECQ